MAALTNWAGNITFSTDVVHRPASVAELQALVAGAAAVRVLGTGHSFNAVADTAGALVSVRDLPPVLELDAAAGTVRVSGGLRYGELAAFLHRHSRALPNLGSLPHISVAGACATGTHGSGDGNRALAGAVRGLVLVGHDGELIELAESDADFAGAVVALGALGAVTELTLAVVPEFEVRQYVYDALPLDDLAAHFDEVTSAAYSVSVFTRYGPDATGQVWLKSTTERPAGDFLGAVAAAGPRHPVPGGDLASATTQLGQPGPSHRRLPHFRLDFTPSSGEEIQSEYFVAREHAVAAISAVRSMADRLADVLLISELRTVAADDFWISPFRGQDRVALHFTWRREPAAVAEVVTELEARLAEFDAVPHWGKFFRLPPARLAELHPGLGDFAALARRYDGSGTFSNDFVRRYVLDAAG